MLRPLSLDPSSYRPFVTESGASNALNLVSMLQTSLVVFLDKPGTAWLVLLAERGGCGRVGEDVLTAKSVASETRIWRQLIPASCLFSQPMTHLP